MKTRSLLVVLLVAVLGLAAWIARGPLDRTDGLPIGMITDEEEDEASAIEPADVDIEGIDRIRGAGRTVEAAPPESKPIPDGAPVGSDFTAVEESPLAVPEGTVVIGRLRGGDGEPVEGGELEMKAQGRAQVKQLRTDPSGRFAVAVGVHGDVTLAASAKGVGRSMDLAVFLPEGQATDVGELRLVGAEVIRGHVRFPNGEPLPGIYLNARAADPLAAPGLRLASAESNADGSFEMTALAPGLFDFEAAGDEGLPILGESSIRAGEERAVLTVDVALLTVSCVNDAGETVPMKGLELSNVLDGEPGEDDDIGSTRRGWSTGKKSFELFVQPQRSYMIQAHDAELRFYFAYLEGDLTAGTHEVALRPDPPTLGAIKVSVPSGSLDGEARISLVQIQRDGQDVQGTLLVGEGEPGAAFLEMRGLVPGTYALTAAVTGSDWIALKDPERTFELSPGASEEFRMETYTGGRVELVVEHEGSVRDEKTRAAVQIRRAGDPEWSEARLHSKRGRGNVFGSRIWIDGTVARSVVLEPGSYSLRVDAKGYLASEVDVTIEPRAATPLNLTLLEN
ncbi:hypothetical protein Poly30_15910 [Planctomycetes bacterium Poly30]|uniref:Uncharacterized protein n=1 Tax=Saltatorellus ferox TaxID=2528018 RepID=A0A518EPR4_9BACT|nr:hypothetical protein Poly30_15910 [Planctomycetes bacterium Poly30]